jgi:hypothetical protein
LAQFATCGNLKADSFIGEFHAHDFHVLGDFGIDVLKGYEQHHTPHIHVRYQNSKAALAIDDGRVLAGDFPPRQLRMVQVWIDLHRDDLLADWELAANGEEPFRIPPLQ